MPVDYKLYPKEFKTVSKHLRTVRAANKCERCGVANYGVGWWRDRQFQYVTKPSEQAKSHTEGRFQADNYNAHPKKTTPDVIVIVLTCAHQCQCTPLCAVPEHLLALCQRCHLQQDAAQHQATRRRNRRAALNNGELFQLDATP